MDFYNRISALAEAYAKDIKQTTETLMRNVDGDTVKSALEKGLLIIPQAIGLYSRELGDSIEQTKIALEPLIRGIVESVGAVWDLNRSGQDRPEQGTAERVVLDGLEGFIADKSPAPLEEKARNDAEIELETGIRADAELAAAAIEEATVELENERSEQRGKAEQETAALEGKFTAERDDLVGKLDKMRDKYFENHPDLDQYQRTDAEGTFKTIKDDAVEALKVDQGTRLAELEARHQGLQENHEQRRKELEGTRARDDDRA